MLNKAGQVKKICCNMVAWLLIWFIALLIVPVCLIMLVIYSVRSFSDKILHHMENA